MKIGHQELIRCPACQLKQYALVLYSEPWNIYLHECVGCGYEIMESEWDSLEREDL